MRSQSQFADDPHARSYAEWCAAQDVRNTGLAPQEAQGLTSGAFAGPGACADRPSAKSILCGAPWPPKGILQGYSECPQTFGEKAVGLPGTDDVTQCLTEFARVIDRMQDLRVTTTSVEVKRMTGVAITEAQTAQMWAVKALTWRD